MNDREGGKATNWKVPIGEKPKISHCTYSLVTKVLIITNFASLL